MEVVLGIDQFGPTQSSSILVALSILKCAQRYSAYFTSAFIYFVDKEIDGVSLGMLVECFSFVPSYNREKIESRMPYQFHNFMGDKFSENK